MSKTFLKAIVFCFSFVVLLSCAQKSVPMKAMSENDWKEKLTPEQYHILREKGTEKPFTGSLLSVTDKGIYVCAGCGTELFTDEMKFDSHCGWPSFDAELPNTIVKSLDTSHGKIRTEITCANCGGHLGHIFDDGPTDTGLRYCVNSLSLDFIPEGSETVLLGGGCFWCIEAVFDRLQGVEEVVSGYAGGTVKNPTYKEVCTGVTGHAEVVKITYNPKVISFKELLEVFFTAHNPTTLNQQGEDIGTQYRSVIYYTTPTQHKQAQDYIEYLTQQQVFNDPIVTEIQPAPEFYSAEDYHQQYFDLNNQQPYCSMVINPKVQKIKATFASKLKPERK